MPSTIPALPDLLPALRSLSRADKIRAIEVLAGELAREEALPPSQAGACYEVLGPIDAFEAAALMLRELEKVKETP